MVFTVVSFLKCARDGTAWIEEDYDPSIKGVIYGNQAETCDVIDEVGFINVFPMTKWDPVYSFLAWDCSGEYYWTASYIT